MNSTHIGIGMTSRRTRERLITRLIERGISDKRVLDAMLDLPRHIFVDEALASRAYEDTALPIGLGQTISQPYTVARMTEIIMQIAPQKVLEIGTGCGYQTAVLAKLVPQVFSIERIGPLQQRARTHLFELNVRNTTMKVGDGYEGWPQHAPFDAIIVTAAPHELPSKLLFQLSDGGRMVIPLGEGREQELNVITRHGDTFEQSVVEGVSFVPMVKGRYTPN